MTQELSDEVSEPSAERPKIITPNTLVKIALILSIVALLIVLAVIPGFNRSVKAVSQQVDDLRQRIEDYRNEIAKTADEIAKIKLDIDYRKRGFLDLSVKSLQELGDGFWLEKVSVEPEMSGIVLKGFIINATPMNQSSIRFDITIGTKNQELIIDRIDPGMSRSFELYVPDVKIEDAGYAKINYVESVATRPR
jgi:hypothetical protein